MQKIIEEKRDNEFSPSIKGIEGQVVRFLHEPDEIQVIADSFNEYLQKLIDNGIDFINEDTVKYINF